MMMGSLGGLCLLTERYVGDQSCLIERVEGRLESAAPIED